MTAHLKQLCESGHNWDTGKDNSPDSEKGLSGEDDSSTISRNSSLDTGNPASVLQWAATVVIPVCLEKSD